MIIQKSHTPFIPSLSGTFGIPARLALNPKMSKEPSSPSRSNVRIERHCFNYEINRSENNNGQRTTRGHKTLGAKWLFEPRFSHQSLLYLDSEVSPKSPTILYRKPLGQHIKKH
jgi:hypothetical protein